MKKCDHHSKGQTLPTRAALLDALRLMATASEPKLFRGRGGERKGEEGKDFPDLQLNLGNLIHYYT